MMAMTLPFTRRWPACVLLGCVLLAGSQTLAQRPLGLDVSHWDGDITASQWAQLYAGGYVFCFAKATESVDYTDSTFVTNMNRAAAAGLYVGEYHFARPSYGNTAVAEAQYFVSVAGTYITTGYLRPVLDLEDGSGLSTSALSTWANAWMNEVQRLTGVEPIIYTNPNYAIYELDSTLANRTAWIAHYLTNADPQTQNPSTGIFTTWTIWQYTDHGLPPGLTGSSDLNVFNGTLAQLGNLVIGGGNSPPTITQNPVNQTTTIGGTASFTVAASGAGLTYRWQKNTVNLSDAGHYSGTATPTLTIAGADSSDSADYRCVVTNLYGSDTSDSASLTVTSSQTILFDNFDGYADQAALQATWLVNGTTLALSTAASHSSPKALYSASGSTARQNRRTIPESVGTDASPLTLSFWLYDLGTSGTGNQWVELRDYSPVSQKQLVEVGVYTGCSSTYYSARVTFSPGNNWQVMNQNGAPARSAGWHQFTVVIKSTTMDFYVDGVLASANRAYANTAGAISFEEVRIGSGYASTSLSAYYDDILIQSGSGATPPTINLQPVAQEVCPGDTATFTVSATGTGTLSYQWQKNNANLTNAGRYSGVTTSTLTVSSAAGEDAADYRCIVTDTVGSTASDEAALTVRAATSISQPPIAQSVAFTGTATFTVTATGAGTLSYQWQKNGSNLSDGGHYSGTNTSALSITPCTGAEIAAYRCVITGGCGTATSNAASLTVAQPADFNGDTDVDQEDFGILQRCLDVTNPAGDPACAATDLNKDSSVNSLDVSLFAGCQSAPLSPANTQCITLP